MGAMTACSSNNAGDEAVVTVTKSAESTASKSSSKAATSTPETTEATETSPVAQPADSASGSGDGCLVGSTGQPEFQGTQCMDKQIASCATDPTLYQAGTTWFTDGTSGWTQTCADQMPSAPTFDQDAYNDQFREDYQNTHPTPTFDPDSADGYGPNQELPPLCVRFPDNYDC